MLAGGNDVWNVGSIPNYVYDQPYGDIVLTSGSKSERPGVTYANDRFMDHLRVPVASEASYAKFAFTCTKNIDYAEYGYDGAPTLDLNIWISSM